MWRRTARRLARAFVEEEDDKEDVESIFLEEDDEEDVESIF